MRVLLALACCVTAFGQVPPQPQFQIQLLGVDPATNRIVTVTLDTRSMTMDRTNPANPVLSCAVPAIGPGLFLDRRTSPPVLSAVLNQISPPSVTYRAGFTFNPSTNLWTSPVLFTATPPNLPALIQVHRNGALVDSDIAGIAYTPPAAGSPPGLQGVLEIKTVSTWPATDTVTAVWVFPFQSINITPTQ